MLTGLDRVLAPAVTPYSSGVQQPGHATAVLSRHPHTRWPAPFNHEQDRASSYGSEGQRRRLGTSDRSADETIR